MTLKEAKNKGYKTVYLNGFIENIDYVMSLTDVKWIEETKSYDGYSMVQCYVC